MPWGESQSTPLKAGSGLEALLMWVASPRTQAQLWASDPQKICEMPGLILGQLKYPEATERGHYNSFFIVMIKVLDWTG